MSQKTTATDQPVLMRNEGDILNYYNECWLNRFSQGHNPKSFAMHFGMFNSATDDNDLAKLKTNEFLVEKICLPTNREITIADFGCGIGGTCMFIAENFPKASVYGVNISEEQLDFAKKQTVKKNLDDRIKYLHKDFSDSGLSSSLIDFVISVESVWHAPDKRTVFDEAYRVLNEKGKFAFIDYFQTRTTENEEEAQRVQEFNNGWGAYVAGTGPIKCFDNDYESEMKAAGFVNVESQSILKDVRQGMINSYNKALRKLNEEVLTDDFIRHYTACVALKYLIDNNLVDYRIVTAEK